MAIAIAVPADLIGTKAKAVAVAITTAASIGESVASAIAKSGPKSVAVTISADMSLGYIFDVGEKGAFSLAADLPHKRRPWMLHSNPPMHPAQRKILSVRRDSSLVTLRASPYFEGKPLGPSG